MAKVSQLKIDYPGIGNSSQFLYNGRSQNSEIIEITSSVISSQQIFVWSGSRRAEERNSVGARVKFLFYRGQISSSQNYFYGMNHIRSITEMTDSSGVIESQSSYNAFGEKGVIKNNVEPDLAFTSQYVHSRSKMLLAIFRSYKPGIGRWISRDPMEELSGNNLFAYCLNEPINNSDLPGLRNPTTLPTIVKPGTGRPSPSSLPFLFWKEYVEWQKKENIRKFNEMQRKLRNDCIKHYKKIYDDCKKAWECIRESDPEEYARQIKKCEEE